MIDTPACLCVARRRGALSWSDGLGIDLTCKLGIRETAANYIGDENQEAFSVRQLATVEAKALLVKIAAQMKRINRYIRALGRSL